MVGFYLLQKYFVNHKFPLHCLVLLAWKRDLAAHARTDDMERLASWLQLLAAGSWKNMLMSSILTCRLDFFFFFLRSWRYLWFHFYLLNAMTDGRFFSQLHCQEMQEAWQHCGNGQIRPGRHPQMNPKSFPKFHENAGHPGSVFSLGGGYQGKSNKTDLQKELLPPSGRFPNLRMDTIDSQSVSAGL